MKKLILFAAILFAGVSIVNAAGPTTPTSTEAKTTLNVNLYPIQSIAVNPSDSKVDIDYRTVENYVSGVTTEKKDHLTVFSVGGFSVQVNSSDDNLSSNHNEKISAATITIKATAGSINALEGGSYSNVSLSKTPTSLFSSASGVINSSFNVDYTGLGGNAYANRFVNGEEPTVHTTTVTYTIAAQ